MANSNGHQYFASPEQVADLKRHIQSYQSPYKDIRNELRRIEHLFLTEHAGFLIGNQCVDFQKQDGVTEMEESIMANSVERRMNDLLLEDEEAMPHDCVCMSYFLDAKISFIHDSKK